LAANILISTQILLQKRTTRPLGCFVECTLPIPLGSTFATPTQPCPLPPSHALHPCAAMPRFVNAQFSPYLALPNEVSGAEDEVLYLNEKWKAAWGSEFALLLRNFAPLPAVCGLLPAIYGPYMAHFVHVQPSMAWMPVMPSTLDHKPQIRNPMHKSVKPTDHARIAQIHKALREGSFITPVPTDRTRFFRRFRIPLTWSSKCPFSMVASF